MQQIYVCVIAAEPALPEILAAADQDKMRLTLLSWINEHIENGGLTTQQLIPSDTALTDVADQIEHLLHRCVTIEQVQVTGAQH